MKNNHCMDTSVKENEEVKKIFKTASEKSVGILDINRKKVEHIPSGLFRFDFSCLQYLYLEGNVISSLPEEFFVCLRSLEWLDLRNNKLTEIPKNVGKHKNLKTLLLGINQLRVLPPEIGFVKTLTGLNLSQNPLEDPPQCVISKGIYAIKAYLLGKLGFSTQDFDNQDGDLHFLESYKSGDDLTEDEEEVVKDKNDISDKNSTYKSSDTCLSANNSFKEVDSVAMTTFDSKDVLTHYGALPEEIPNSYIFKPWKTGVFFKKETISEKLPVRKNLR